MTLSTRSALLYEFFFFGLFTVTYCLHRPLFSGGHLLYVQHSPGRPSLPVARHYSAGWHSTEAFTRLSSREISRLVSRVSTHSSSDRVILFTRPGTHP
ncbi:hypothetical protein EDB83DRAFT_1886807 [Lactarius deliciosus]|nr:hypothetical protein EDB83DRAFT_1886807 [Lactarius deliciosus]